MSRVFEKEFAKLTKRELVNMILAIGDKADKRIAELKRSNNILKARLEIERANNNQPVEA